MENVISCPHCAKPVLVPTPTVPPGLNQLCEKFPELCREVTAVRGELKSLKASLEGHSKPSIELIKQWSECPECKDAWNKLKESNPELFTPVVPEPAGGKTGFFFETDGYGLGR